MIRILVFAFAICCFVSPSFAVEFRSIDGSGNNLASPGIGSTGQFFVSHYSGKLRRRSW